MKADLFETDFSKATVITMFLLPDINLKLRPKILDLKPGTRIVSNTFTMGDWKADETADLGAGGNGNCNESWCTALLWIVPAKVGGTHKLPQGELTLKQEYQMLSGTLRTEGKTIAIANGRVRGEEISFRAGGRDYRGRVEQREGRAHQVAIRIRGQGHNSVSAYAETSCDPDPEFSSGSALWGRTRGAWSASSCSPGRAVRCSPA